MENFQITDRYTSYFNKEVLCVGEFLKIVISEWRPIVDYKISLKIETTDGHLLTPPETLLLEEPDLLPGRVRRLIGIQTSQLEPGLYIIKVYVAPPKYEVAEEIAEEYAIAGHVFQLLALDQYDQCFQELFGEDWDDPMYSDSREWKQLNDFFASYNVSGITQDNVEYIETKRAARESGRERGVASWSSDSWKYDSIEGLILSRIVEVIDAAMGSAVRLPFSVYHNVEVTGLPHVNLTKYVWLLNVLGSTWTDLFFFSPLVRFDINASEDSIDLTIFSWRLTEEDEGPQWLTPPHEPPLFHVVRNTIQAGLNCELRYDAYKGVTLMVSRNQSFLSMSAK